VRVISKFHDFYDGVAAHGFDRSVVYLRAQSLLSEELDAAYACELPGAQDTNTYGLSSVSVHAWPFWIAVAGRRYHGMVTRRSTPRNAGSFYPRDEFFYSADDYRGYVSGLTGIDPLAPERYRRNRWREDKRRRLAEWLSAEPEDISRLMADRGHAVVAYTGRWLEAPRRREPLILNPRLSDFDFFKVRGPYQLFQDLSMWIGGVLPGREAMRAAVGDKDRFVERGFDAVTSFRGPNR